MSQIVRARFRVRAEVRMGETVFLSGSPAALGNWDPNAALQLVTSPEAYPVWFHNDPILLQSGDNIEYKYLVCSGGKFQRWEDIPINRSLTIPSTDVFLEDTLNISKQSLETQAESNDHSMTDSDAASGDVAMQRESADVSLPPNASDNSDICSSSACSATGSPMVRSIASEPIHQTVSLAQSGTAAVETGNIALTGHISPTRSGTGHVSSKPPRSDRVRTSRSHTVRNRNRKPLVSAEGSHQSGRMRRHDAVSIEEGDGVVIVQYHLPVLLSQRGDGSWHVAWDDENLLSRKRHSLPQITEVRIQWIGVPNVFVPPDQQDAVVAALAPFRCYPVFLSEKLSEDHYNGFCKDTLWPLFHNVMDVYGEYPTRWWNAPKQKERWLAYTEVNRIFADKVVEVYNDEDLVWIHDYHLLLLPSYLARRRLRSANIGLFLHAPFPSSEVFRSLSVRDDILRGIICADHIGFHLFEYARHFLTSCRRLLGLEYTTQPGGRIALHYQGRAVIVTVSHVGIEPDILSARVAQDIVLAQHRYYSSMVGHKLTSDDTLSVSDFPKVIVGAETLERLKGIPLKLLAFERFLAENPSWCGRVVLVQVGIHDTSRAKDCEGTLREVEVLVRRINARYTNVLGQNTKVPPIVDTLTSDPNASESSLSSTNSTSCGSLRGPVVYFLKRVGTISLDDRLGLWLAADVMMSTAIRDSLNLWPLEFVYVSSKQEQCDSSLLASRNITAIPRPGVAIVSEFSGCSRVLNGALRVNPWQQDHVVAAIRSALEMPTDEAIARMHSNMSFIRDCTTSAWAVRVLLDLKRASKQATARTYMGYGLGLNFRQMAFGSNFKLLNFESVVDAYRRTSRRLFVFDYGGVLNNMDDTQRISSALRKKAVQMGLLTESIAPEAPVAPDVLHALSALASDPRNTVLIVSGKEREILDRVFSKCPEVCLAAEHGFYYRFGVAPGPLTNRSLYNPGRTSPAHHAESAGELYRNRQALTSPHSERSDAEHEWYRIGEHFDNSWKEVGLTIMEGYTARTNGTYVTQKGSALVWDFGDADAEFGSMQAKELQDHLTSVLKHFPVEIVQGARYVEIRPRGVNKGLITRHFIDMLEGRSPRGGLALHDALRHEETAGRGANEDASSSSDDDESDSSSNESDEPSEATPMEKSPERVVHAYLPSHLGVSAPRTSTSDGSFADSDSASVDASPSAERLSDYAGMGLPVIDNKQSHSVKRTDTRQTMSTRSLRHAHHQISITPVDFVLAVGDDIADELMFAALQKRWDKIVREREIERSRIRRRQEKERSHLRIDRSASGNKLSRKWDNTEASPLPDESETSESSARIQRQMRESTISRSNSTTLISPRAQTEMSHAVPNTAPLVSSKLVPRPIQNVSVSDLDNSQRVRLTEIQPQPALRTSSLTMRAPQRLSTSLESRGSGHRRSYTQRHVRNPSDYRVSRGFLEASSMLPAVSITHSHETQRSDSLDSFAQNSGVVGGEQVSAANSSHDDFFNTDNRQESTPSTSILYQFTVVIGKKPSAAHYYLDDASGVSELLRMLRKVAYRVNYNRSMTDLAHHQTHISSTSGSVADTTPHTTAFSTPYSAATVPTSGAQDQITNETTNISTATTSSVIPPCTNGTVELPNLLATSTTISTTSGVPPLAPLVSIADFTSLRKGLPGSATMPNLQSVRHFPLPDEWKLPMPNLSEVAATTQGSGANSVVSSSSKRPPVYTNQRTANNAPLLSQVTSGIATSSSMSQFPASAPLTVATSSSGIPMMHRHPFSATVGDLSSLASANNFGAFRASSAANLAGMTEGNLGEYLEAVAENDTPPSF